MSTLIGLKYQGRSMHWVERVVCDHGVFVRKPKTVRELSANCSQEYGGTPEMWIKRNKDKCGVFGSVFSSTVYIFQNTR